MLSDKACSLLRDFMLVFDLDKFFKGSTEVTESDAGKVLEYMKSVFEQASLTAPTTYMSPKNLSTYLKSLRNTNQKFKKEHGATYELIKCAFDLCHMLKEKIKSKSAEMRDVWTNDWKLDLQSDQVRSGLLLGRSLGP